MFQKCFLTICIQNHTYVMSHLQLCEMSLRQMKTRVSINHQWIELCLLSQCASLCMEQYAWIHAISSRMHAWWFFFPSNYQSHILKRSTWLDRTTWLEKNNMPYVWRSNYRTMDQVSWLDLGSNFHSAMLVTTSWSCFMLLGHHWFHSQSLLWPPVLVPSHPGPARFSPCWTHSLVLPWFPWNCCINGICCLDPTPLQIMTLWALHFVYNDKVCEISEVPKLLDRLLDFQYTPLGCTDLLRRFKQDNLCRADLLDNFLDNSLLKLWLLVMAQRQLKVDKIVT